MCKELLETWQAEYAMFQQGVWLIIDKLYTRGVVDCSTYPPYNSLIAAHQQMVPGGRPGAARRGSWTGVERKVSHGPAEVKLLGAANDANVRTVIEYVNSV